eukprot:jgi/Chrzof1/6131/Cz17g12010.t1
MQQSSSGRNPGHHYTGGGGGGSRGATAALQQETSSLQERKRRLEAEVAMLANRRQELLAEMTKDREISVLSLVDGIGKVLQGPLAKAITCAYVAVQGLRGSEPVPDRASAQHGGPDVE